MTEQQQSYRQIMKATSIFGGVQVFNIIISIVRSKFIAILLGPAGMGIAGLLTSTTGLIGSITNFGLGTSAVKDIASACETGNDERIATTITVLRRLVWITGLLGALLTLVFASWLSTISFGNTDYTLAFVWLSVTLLFQQLTSGQNVLLQGLRKLKHLAKANMLGSFLGLIISVPIYYVWGIDGIVPTIIITSLASLTIARFFARKIDVKPVSITSRQTFIQGRGMLQMGFMLSLSGLITTAASYLVRIFISRTGGVDDVGLYTAGFNIIGNYVGLVFTAMATDYYPRLSGVAHDKKKAGDLINQQAEVAILILAPILTVFLVFINWVVIMLYSSKFVAINGMIHWAALGMFFKAASWSIGFIFIAKGNSKLFFFSELASNTYLLVFNIAGYHLFELDGLGISFLISYIVVYFQVFLIARLKYKFRFYRSFYRIFIFQLFVGVLCFLVVRSLGKPFNYIVGAFFILLSTIYSFRKLDKLLNLKQILFKMKDKK